MKIEKYIFMLIWYIVDGTMEIPVNGFIKGIKHLLLLQNLLYNVKTLLNELCIVVNGVLKKILGKMQRNRELYVRL